MENSVEDIATFCNAATQLYDGQADSTRDALTLPSRNEDEVCKLFRLCAMTTQDVEMEIEKQRQVEAEDKEAEQQVIDAAIDETLMIEDGSVDDESASKRARLDGSPPPTPVLDGTVSPLMDTPSKSSTKIKLHDILTGKNRYGHARRRMNERKDEKKVSRVQADLIEAANIAKILGLANSAERLSKNIYVLQGAWEEVRDDLNALHENQPDIWLPDMMVLCTRRSVLNHLPKLPLEQHNLSEVYDAVVATAQTWNADSIEFSTFVPSNAVMRSVQIPVEMKIDSMEDIIAEDILRRTLENLSHANAASVVENFRALDDAFCKSMDNSMGDLERASINTVLHVIRGLIHILSPTDVEHVASYERLWGPSPVSRYSAAKFAKRALELIRGCDLARSMLAELKFKAATYLDAQQAIQDGIDELEQATTSAAILEEGCAQALTNAVLLYYVLVIRSIMLQWMAEWRWPFFIGPFAQHDPNSEIGLSLRAAWFVVVGRMWN